MSARFAHELPLGAEVVDECRTRFRFWAPDQTAVSLDIEGLSRINMQRGKDDVFECTVYCGSGTRYRYRLSDGTRVPDPLSRLQAGGVHGTSVVCNPREFIWHQSGWKGRPWTEMVIYELHVGCYHGFTNIEKQLPELVELGVTAIELMPIAAFSGQRNWGYDGVLPFAPHSDYGTSDQLKHLIDVAHEAGICVYLDVVYNHFGPDGNFLGEYASAFFDSRKHSPWGAAIDFSKQEVRNFFTQNALYWLLEYRFDGLRFDAVHQISDPAWLDEMAAEVRAAVEPGRHVHLMLENEHNNAAHLRYPRDQPREQAGSTLREIRQSGQFDAQWNDDGHNVLHVLLTGEHHSYYENYATAATHKLARCLAEGFIYQGQPSPTHLCKPRGSPSGHLPPHAFILFLQNHDQIGNRAFGERLTTLTTTDNLRAAITLLLLSPQIPLLFMGEEWGTHTPFLFFTDFSDQLAAAVREGRRREFSALPAFADPDIRATIPDPNAVTTYTSSIPDRGEMLSEQHRKHRLFYRDLLALRRHYIVPYLDSCRSVDARVIGEKAVLARWRLSNDDTLSIAINFGESSIRLEHITGELLFSSKTFENSATNDANNPPRRHDQLEAHCTQVYLASAPPSARKRSKARSASRSEFLS